VTTTPPDAAARATVMSETDTFSVHYSAPHPPRKSSPTYVRAHHDVVYVKLTPCWICGLIPNEKGKFDSPSMVNETHHNVIEESAFLAVDIAKVEADEPAWDWTKVDPLDNATFYNAGDADAAMLCVCSVHHRATRPLPDHRSVLGVGIHHIPYPVWILQRYVKAEYPLFVADDSQPFNPAVHLHPNVAAHVALAKATQQAIGGTRPGG
jgi:hypothetical protein